MSRPVTTQDICHWESCKPTCAAAEVAGGRRWRPPAGSRTGSEARIASASFRPAATRSRIGCASSAKIMLMEDFKVWGLECCKSRARTWVCRGTLDAGAAV